MYDPIAHRRRKRNENPKWAAAVRRKEKYGITDCEFRKMLKKQNNRCAICKQKEWQINWRTGKVRLLSIDHDHETNQIRKLLCWHCNLGIGIFKENWKLLQAASNYLKTNKGTR